MSVILCSWTSTSFLLLITLWVPDSKCPITNVWASLALTHTRLIHKHWAGSFMNMPLTNWQTLHSFYFICFSLAESSLMIILIQLLSSLLTTKTKAELLNMGQCYSYCNSISCVLVFLT